eukprot:scaffold131960_cov63-Phaeocystis_antarctica.AAC.1
MHRGQLSSTVPFHRWRCTPRRLFHQRWHRRGCCGDQREKRSVWRYVGSAYEWALRWQKDSSRRFAQSSSFCTRVSTDAAPKSSAKSIGVSLHESTGRATRQRFPKAAACAVAGANTLIASPNFGGYLGDR